MVFAYGCLDVINQTEGVASARHTVVVAAVARAVVFALLLITSVVWPVLWPIASTSFWLFVFAELGMVLSQYWIDIPIFDTVKRRLHLPFWARYNVSNLISQPIAVLVFSVGASWALALPFWSVAIGALSLRVVVLPFLLTPVYHRWQAALST